eukprot:TRINITY_DN7296_c0_g1_i1.p1 TRINITY_DN7296_c0_g1~~TRINITY_DN7296_c0_g1_i1.p1  ORF type:complete len:193 (+),score=41.45 TRINITY_DN7296_c0_g1_i1:37-615(+)
MLKLLLAIVSGIVSWILETPPNYDEKRVKQVKMFPTDTDLPKWLALTFPPFVTALPAIHWLYGYFVYGYEDTGFTVLEIVGFGMMFSGSVFLTVARNELGRFYSFDRSIKERHKIVKTGPYSVVAHPGYTGMMMISLGNAIWTLSPFALLSLVTTAIVLSGIPKEEEMFIKEFGDEYSDFVSSRSRLIPGIY